LARRNEQTGIDEILVNDDDDGSGGGGDCDDDDDDDNCHNMQTQYMLSCIRTFACHTSGLSGYG